MPDQTCFTYTGLALVVHLLAYSTAHASISGTNDMIAVKSPAEDGARAQTRRPMVGAQILDDWEMTELDAQQLAAMRLRGPASDMDAVRLPTRQAQ